MDPSSDVDHRRGGSQQEAGLGVVAVLATTRVRESQLGMLGCDPQRVFERFDARAYRAVVLAGIEARDRRFGHLGTESLLMGLLLETNERAGASGAASDLVERVLKRAGYEALEEEAANVSPAHILLAAARVGEGEGLNALDALDISPTELRARLYG